VQVVEIKGKMNKLDKHVAANFVLCENDFRQALKLEQT
jgi:hypothetical protein